MWPVRNLVWNVTAQSAPGTNTIDHHSGPPIKLISMSYAYQDLSDPFTQRFVRVWHLRVMQQLDGSKALR